MDCTNYFIDLTNLLHQPISKRPQPPRPQLHCFNTKPFCSLLTSNLANSVKVMAATAVYSAWQTCSTFICKEPVCKSFWRPIYDPFRRNIGMQCNANPFISFPPGFLIAASRGGDDSWLYDATWLFQSLIISGGRSLPRMRAMAAHNDCGSRLDAVLPPYLHITMDEP